MKPPAKSTKKRPGPKPKLITLYPFTFDEVVETLLIKKPEKSQDQSEQETTGKPGEGTDA
jgi:hypothetical protein